MVTKAQIFALILIVNIQINHVLLFNKICVETGKDVEDVLHNVWTNLAWWNVRLEELNLQAKADFHSNLMVISTRKNISLQISFTENTKGFSNDASRLTLLSRCETDFYGFEHFIRIRKPLTIMIVVLRTLLVENLLRFFKEIKMSTSFYFLDIERQVIYTLSFLYLIP